MTMLRFACLFACAAAILSVPPVSALALEIRGHPDFDSFVQEMADRHGFDVGIVTSVLSEAKPLKRVLKLSDPPETAERKIYWREYRRRHVNPEIIVDGVRFYERHRELLERAEHQYGVPAEIIVAILGVETRYGKVLGGFRVLDVLGTLGFNHPSRSKFFLGELESFLILILDRREVNPLALKGSYAGAFGMSQFIPSSFDRYAVDFNADGQRNLFEPADAIGSVGNFLVEHGWSREQPVAFSAEVSGTLSLEPSVKPEHSLQAIEASGLVVDFKGAPPFDGPYAVVDLEGLSGTTYRVGTINYYALTRYNRSNKYAMAVFDLGTEIGNRIKQES